MALADQIAALEAALAAGVLSISENGRTVTYPSPEALTKALASLYAQRSHSSGSAGRGWAMTKLASPGTQ